MSNCPGCDNSSTTYSRCNPPVSTNCVFYQGPTKICENDTSFSICKGDVLSNVQEILFEGICDLKELINVSDIQFTCSPGWISSNQKTLHKLLEEITKLDCEYNTIVDGLNLLVQGQTSTVYNNIPVIDPFVEVCLGCCVTPSGACNTPSVLHLSDALNKIASCICNLRARVEAAESKANTAFTNSEQALDLYDCLEQKNNALIANLAIIYSALTKPISQGGPGYLLPPLVGYNCTQ